MRHRLKRSKYLFLAALFHLARPTRLTHQLTHKKHPRQKQISATRKGWKPVKTQRRKIELQLSGSIFFNLLRTSPMELFNRTRHNANLDGEEKNEKGGGKKRNVTGITNNQEPLRHWGKNTFPRQRKIEVDQHYQPIFETQGRASPGSWR